MDNQPVGGGLLDEKRELGKDALIFLHVAQVCILIINNFFGGEKTVFTFLGIERILRIANDR